MAEQRLPIVNADDGVWGDIIRQYLMKEHYNGDADLNQTTSTNGGHQKITIRAGTATAGTAPLKFTTGTLLTTAEAGAIEFNSDKLYFTKTTGPTRQAFATYDVTGATGDIYYRDGSGNFTRLAVGSGGDFLTIASGIPSWTASIVGKALDNTNSATLKDTNFTLQDATDTTKQVKFDVASSQTTGTLRTITLPALDGTLVTIAGSETLINKTISGGSNIFSNIGLSSLTTTGTANSTTYLRGDGQWTVVSTGMSRSFITTSGAYTAGSGANTDYIYIIAGAHSGTLPSASANTNRYTFKNNHTASVTLTRVGADTIEGSTSITIAPSSSVDLVSNGTSTWIII
ncbi:MAG: hypothetical protein WAW80_02625 [Candidatus Saccharimonadales bacterium]